MWQRARRRWRRRRSITRHAGRRRRIPPPPRAARPPTGQRSGAVRLTRQSERRGLPAVHHGSGVALDRARHVWWGEAYKLGMVKEGG